MSQSRQLAAIMFADIAGYTAMMQEDEVHAMKLRKKFQSKLEAEISIHGGKIIKVSGDGALCSFASAIESVRVAYAVQLAMQEEPKVPLRIGIHQADVIFEESEIYGDGVNIASRLESFAVPGSIFISAKVHDELKNQIDIQTVSLGKYLLKNVKEPVEIYAVSNPGLQVPEKKKLEGKGEKYQAHKSLAKIKGGALKFALPVLILGIAGFLFISRWTKIQRARNELLPAIQKMTEENFVPPTKAFDLAKEAEKYIPNDSALLKLWPKIAWSTFVESDPPGANLYWKDYNDIGGAWKFIAVTPSNDIWLPQGHIRYKLEKKGFQTIYQPADLKLRMDSIGKLPENMVRVNASKTYMLISGLEQYGGKDVSGFLIDKYEVRNKEFKSFVDAGGYNNRKFWVYPFYLDGREISWDESMNLFHDKTGKPGPAEWEVGTYPDGKGDHPVTGISWYEAMAYAKYAGKALPTVYQWTLVANTWDASDIVPKSNFMANGTVPVGSLDGLARGGVHDIAGNAREWCFNESDKKDWHYSQGGGWNDPTYAFNDAHAEPSMDRSPSNGFRCIKLLDGDSTYNKLSGPIAFAFRDYHLEKPVDDKTFNIFLRQYTYDRSPLNAVVTNLFDTSLCKIEKITLDAAYNKEKLPVYLFLPKNSSPPYQTVVYYPGSGVFYVRDLDYRNLWEFDFILKSGRAVLYPVFKGTLERSNNVKSEIPNESVSFKEHVISWAKDLSRSLDYLETRKDIAPGKFGFFGFSWGGEFGPIMCATEPRLKAAVFHVGGLLMQKSLPEVDVLNFLPRVKIPVLMLNGKNDMFFPVETSQKPMFNLLGTEEKNKKINIYEGGHLVPRQELIKESLTWFDKYLGVIK